jgi:hypothetical protein
MDIWQLATFQDLDYFVVAVFIADMDPGRESIIYRMTSTRMKKDN